MGPDLISRRPQRFERRLRGLLYVIQILPAAVPPHLDLRSRMVREKACAHPRPAIHQHERCAIRAATADNTSLARMSKDDEAHVTAVHILRWQLPMFPRPLPSSILRWKQGQAARRRPRPQLRPRRRCGSHAWGQSLPTQQRVTRHEH